MSGTRQRSYLVVPFFFIPSARPILSARMKTAMMAAMSAIFFHPQAQAPLRLFCLMCPNFSSSLSLQTLTLRLLPLCTSSLLSRGVFSLPPVKTDMKPAFFGVLGPCTTGPTC
jgi:hypothetical protein